MANAVNAQSANTANTVRYDTAAMHDDATNSRLTASVAGIYAVNAQVDWAGATAGREPSLRRNGVTSVAAARETSTTVTEQQVSTQVRLQAGEFVEAWVFQESGGNLNVNKLNEYSPEFSTTWLAPGP